MVSNDEYNPPPLISSVTILGAGVFFIAVTIFLPPFVLFVAILASLVIPYSFRVNDDGATRRVMMQQFLENDHGAIRRRNAFPTNKVELTSSFWKNQRGILLHTNVMIPKDQDVKAVICFCHGYADHPTYTKALDLAFLCHTGGFAILIVEYEGHGQSDGALGLVKDWNVLVEDVNSYFQETLSKVFPHVAAFLVGEVKNTLGTMCANSDDSAPLKTFFALYNSISQWVVLWLTP
jgi:hypothetical protein